MYLIDSLMEVTLAILNEWYTRRGRSQVRTGQISSNSTLITKGLVCIDIIICTVSTHLAHRTHTHKVIWQSNPAAQPNRHGRP